MNSAELQRSNANYDATALLERVRGLFDRDNHLLGEVVIRSVLEESPGAVRQHVMTRVDVLPQNQTAGTTEVLDYGSVVFVTEVLGREALLSRLRDLSERRFQVGEHMVTSQGLGFYDDYEPSRNSRSGFPRRVFNVSFGSVQLSYRQLLHPKLKPFASIYDAIQEFFQLETFNGQSDGRLGQLQLLIPNLNARFETLSLTGNHLRIKIAGAAPPDSTKLALTYKRDHLTRSLDACPQNKEITCELAFLPTELSIWLFSKDGFLADFHTENEHYSTGADPILPKKTEAQPLLDIFVPPSRSTPTSPDKEKTPKKAQRLKDLKAQHERMPAAIVRTTQTTQLPVARRKKEMPTFKTALEVYRASEIVGQGGAGVVYKVQTDDAQIFAIKCLDPRKATTEKRKRFKTELHFCAKNNHKNIVTVLDQGIISINGEDCPFYVMAHYPATLRDLMNKSIPYDRILPLFSQVLDGIEAAHLKRVWHRDLKPSNVLYEATEELLVVADFGIAHFAEEQLYTLVETSSHDRLANFEYAAPEQCRRGIEVNHKADIYALGLILNEMFTGHVPRGEDYPRIGGVAPQFAYLDEIVAEMVQHAPENRPNSIDDIKKILKARGNEFVSRQELDALQQTVIPTTVVTDSLIENPVQVDNVDVRGNTLVAILNQIPSPEWIRAFVHPRAMSFIPGTEPVNWTFSRNEAMVQLSHFEGQARQVLAYFKDYVNSANAQYKDFVAQAAWQKEEEEKRALAQKIADEERRQRILNNLRS